MDTLSSIARNIDAISKALEPLIRRIIREELERFSRERTPIFRLTPDMPIYEDLEDITLRKVSDEIEIYSDNEVWN